MWFSKQKNSFFSTVAASYWRRLHNMPTLLKSTRIFLLLWETKRNHRVYICLIHSHFMPRDRFIGSFLENKFSMFYECFSLKFDKKNLCLCKNYGKKRTFDDNCFSTISIPSLVFVLPLPCPLYSISWS